MHIFVFSTFVVNFGPWERKIRCISSARTWFSIRHLEPILLSVLVVADAHTEMEKVRISFLWELRHIKIVISINRLQNIFINEAHNCFHRLSNCNNSITSIENVHVVFRWNYHHHARCNFLSQRTTSDVIMQQKRHRLSCDVTNAILSSQCALPKVKTPATIWHPEVPEISENIGDYNTIVENQWIFYFETFHPYYKHVIQSLIHNSVTIFKSVFHNNRNCWRAPYGIGHLVILLHLLDR